MEAEGKRLRNDRFSTDRIYLFDNIKFIAIVLVVIGHAIDFLTRQNGNWLEKSLFVAIYSVHMPLFIFISGLFLKPMDKSTKFPKQKVISFILIGIVLRVLTSVLKLLIGVKESYSLFDMYDSYTWFMWAIAVFISIVWLFRDYDKKFIFGLSLLLGCMAGYDKYLGDKFVLMRIVVFLPIFFAGYFIKTETLIKLFSNKWLKILSAVFILVYLALCLLNHDFIVTFRPMFTGRNTFSVLGDMSSFGFFFRALCYIISAAFGFSIMCLVPNRSFGLISSAGAKTMQIYFWHKMFLIIFERFHLYGIIEAFIGSTAATAIYILLAVGITFLCSLKIFSFPTKQLLSLGK